MSATWLADVLRGTGLRVTEEPGWEKRGRPGPFTPRGVLAHHTSSNPAGGNFAALRTVRDGRPDLPGPLSQLMLGRDGTWHVVAAGRCNHAGNGLWRGIANGNRDFIGVEAENDGRGEPWPEVQLDSYERGVAAILTYLKADDSMVAGHKEFALPKGRKVDPTFDMVAFREDVAAHMRGEGVLRTPLTVQPSRAMLRKGDRGASVKKLQQLLNANDANLRVDEDFGPSTENAVKAFQRKKKLVADGLVGPKTWDALGLK